MDNNDEREILKKSINDLLDHKIPDEVPGLDETTNRLPKPKTPINSQMAKANSAKAKAKSMMSKLLNFYLSEQIIEEHEYIQAKAEIEEMALGMLIRQMENSETAINHLMTQIEDQVDVAPRMFEVLSDLQRTLLDIVKSQTMYILAIEENTKKISREIDIYTDSEKPTKQNDKNKSGGVRVRGTKDLMRTLREAADEFEQNELDDDTETIDVNEE